MFFDTNEINQHTVFSATKSSTSNLLMTTTCQQEVVVINKISLSENANYVKCQIN